MKKLILSIFVAALSLSIYSCRETTEEKAEEAVEAAGEDIEHNTRKAGEEIEEGAEEIEREIDEEIHEDDEIHANHDMEQ